MGSNNVRIKPTINRKIASPALNTLQRAKKYGGYYQHN